MMHALAEVVKNIKNVTVNKNMSDEIIPYSEFASSVKLGLYHHFKGGKYELIGIARHSEDLTEEFAVYKSLKTGYVWIRPLKMFLENIDRADYKGPRFKFVA